MDEDLIARAASYAAELHAGDLRKGSSRPYFDAHLVPVASIVRGAGGDAAQVAAAYLHDAAEEQGGEPTLEEIRRRFGDDVAAIVRDLSDSLVDTRAGEQKEPWRQRKQAYIDRLAGAPIRSLEVAAADKLHNATAILEDHARVGDEVWARFTVTDPAEQLWYYATLAELMVGRLGAHPTATALRQAVERLTAVVARAPRGS